MNYFWTIQSKDVLELINKNGYYYPDKKQLNGSYTSAYKIVLDSFNQINKSSYKGLIFGFAKKANEGYFGNIDELYQYLLNNPLVTNAFHLWSDNYVILQLQYHEKFNMIPIDFNDFIQIIPPIWDTTAYAVICDCINRGINTNGYTLPSFTQIHAPYIKKENVISVCKNFDKSRSDANKRVIVFP